MASVPKNQGEQSKDSMSSHVGLPALHISSAFPQATPASVFPQPVSDYYQFDDLLSSEEKALRKRVRDVMEKDIAPIMTESSNSHTREEMEIEGGDELDRHGTYVLVITSLKEIGTYLGYSVYHAKSMRFLSCNEALRYSTSQEKKDEAYFMSLLRTVESTTGLYYSYSMDLTLNLQRACKLTEERLQKPLWKQADPRFVWNRSLLEELIEAKLDAFVLPMIQGNILSWSINF
ncbi:uncharacterized protein A4U43_C05F5160 [Asparagus officinalis]|uniref:SAC domain-containing protein n=1 Tax=Asparagus officinalis TaxID=4686 RepID=A0A5P1ET71_ASPOF|nr:uncharacterized protein A4U43_C05F5160 [Asparagus officinalis]